MAGGGSPSPGLTGQQRRRLRALAHGLRPLVQVGKAGLTEGLARSAEAALLAHELIKVQFVAFKEAKSELGRELASRLGAEVVGEVGHQVILYRPHPDPALRRVSADAPAERPRRKHRRPAKV